MFLLFSKSKFVIRREKREGWEAVRKSCLFCCNSANTKITAGCSQFIEHGGPYISTSDSAQTRDIQSCCENKQKIGSSYRGEPQDWMCNKWVPTPPHQTHITDCVWNKLLEKRQILPDMVSLYGEFLEFQPLLSLHHDTRKRKWGKKRLHGRKTLRSETHRFPATYWVQN